ncbi:cathepsin L1-like [Brachionus plicatilis]|uniref:Cathepsin L1-like n=1 Tax=Brachionus plicatilis TaxID=10195 RepID=A0A3M7RQB9_BRAPC|nr:cathepsin L1-like [Brachionus plicatilis]
MKALTLKILFVCVCSVFLKQLNFDKWDEFKRRFGRKFHLNTELKHMQNFFQKLEKIDVHNKEYALGKTKYLSDINKLTDLDQDQLKRKTGFIPSEPSRVKRGAGTKRYAYGPNRPIFRIYFADQHITLPESVDWTKSGWSEPVSDQLDCGSCWAFSSATMISAQLWIKKRKNVPISPQDFIDCSTYLSTKGCDGGSPANALEFTILNGSSTSDVYQYRNQQESCRVFVREQNPLYKITSFYKLDENHDALKQAVALLGPVSVSINSEDGFQSYKSGIYDGIDAGRLECSINDINHAVTVVGYGTDKTTNTDYWLIKNTWGSDWGESGYVRMLRTKDNLCGIYKYMFVPVIE